MLTVVLRPGLPLRAWHRPIRRLGLIALLSFSIGGCSSLSAFLFFPHEQHYQTPDALNVEYETILLDSEGFSLVNWLLKSDRSQDKKASILYLHGNGENISTHMNSVAWLTLMGYDVFLLDYRGYGKSEGSSTLRSALVDVQQAHRWLSQHSQRPLILFGQSMGGALAITYAASIDGLADDDLRPFQAIISESAPASWPQVAREAMRQHWLTWIIQIPASLIESRYDAEKHIGSLSDTPILLMHSKQDTVVSYEHFQQLVQAASDHPSLTSYQTNGNHTQGLAYEQARSVFVRFIESAIADESAAINRANHASPQP